MSIKQEQVMKYNIFARYNSMLLKKVMNEVKHKTVLDVGCGIGLTADMLSKKTNFYGIDLDEEAITYMNKTYDGEFIVADAMKIPYGDNFFDYVICTSVLEHLKDDVKVLKEIKRVLKPRGKLVLIVPSLNGLIKPSNICHNHTDKSSTEKHYRKGYTKERIFSLIKRMNMGILQFDYGMIFLSHLTFELTKIIYNILNPSFKRQSDLLKNRESTAFRIYRLLFFILLWTINFDRLLSKFIKRGGSLLVLAEK